MLHNVFVAFMLFASALPLIAGEKSTQQLGAELFALIDQADEMVVYSEGFKREFVIYRSSDRKDFEDLKSAITLNRDGPFVCACMDGPEIALLKNGKEIAAVWNHEGTAIGSSVWKGDWENSDPERWLNWFDARGVKQPRDFFDQMQAQQKKAGDDQRRWLDTMPSGLKPLWPDALKQYQPEFRKYPDLRPLNDALSKQYPDMYDRIRALMAWYGSGAGPWSGFPGYEEIAERLLRQYPNAVLIRAVENRDLTAQQIEGAARILGGWTAVPDPTPIPAKLRQALLEHCLKSSDEDKIERAKRAFAPTR